MLASGTAATAASMRRRLRRWSIATAAMIPRFVEMARRRRILSCDWERGMRQKRRGRPWGPPRRNGQSILRLDYQLNLKPNWIWRGKFPWLAATNPKFASVGLVLGPPRMGVLNTLKTSKRNWKFTFSVKLNFLLSDMSHCGR